MRLVLKVISFQSSSMGADAEKIFDENGGTFGRTASSDWVLSDPDRYISGRHGKVFYENGRFHVSDTSTNGLSIEGRAGPIGKGNSVPLAHGDVLLLGEYRLAVNLEEELGAETELRLEGTEADVPLEPEESGSLDPLSFLPPEPSSSSEGEFSPPESQADHSSAARDHFRVPGVSNDEHLPTFELQPEPDQAPAEPDPQPEPDVPTDSGIVELLDEECILGEDELSVDVGQQDEKQPKLKLAEEPIHQVDTQPSPLSPTDIEFELETGLEPEPEPMPEPVPLREPEPAPVPEPEPTPDFATGRESAPANPPGERPGKEVPSEPLPQSGGAVANDLELYEAFMQGLGVTGSAPPDSPAEAMRAYGELVRLVIESLMDLLRSRSAFKNEFRMQATMIQLEENNPLKFSPNQDEALRIFFGPSSPGYLGLEESVEGCLADMKLHQVALVAGLQAVFHEFSDQMSPARYKVDTGEGVKGLLQSVTQKSRNWDQFCAYCERLENEASGGVSTHFSNVFAQAYEERAQMLSDLGIGQG